VHTCITCGQPKEPARRCWTATVRSSTLRYRLPSRISSRATVLHLADRPAHALSGRLGRGGAVRPASRNPGGALLSAHAVAHKREALHLGREGRVLPTEASQVPRRCDAPPEVEMARVTAEPSTSVISPLMRSFDGPLLPQHVGTRVGRDWEPGVGAPKRIPSGLVVIEAGSGCGNLLDEVPRRRTQVTAVKSSSQCVVPFPLRPSG
jgi:hypothetical protein